MRLTAKLVPICLVVFCGWLLAPAIAQAQGPDFSGEDDILNGQNYMLRSDDIGLSLIHI